MQDRKLPQFSLGVSCVVCTVRTPWLHLSFCTGLFQETSGQESVITTVSSHQGQLSVWLSKQGAVTRNSTWRNGCQDFTELCVYISGDKETTLCFYFCHLSFCTLPGPTVQYMLAKWVSGRKVISIEISTWCSNFLCNMPNWWLFSLL